MLDSFRKANNSLIVKILFGILVLAFGGAFGGAGLSELTNMRLDNAPAIRVGHHDFTPDEVVDEFRRDVDQIGGGKITVEQARQFGLMQRTIQRIVSRTLIDEAAKNMGLVVDEDTLRRTIAAVPEFQNTLHMFDKSLYRRTLANAHLTERQFLDLERGNILQKRLVMAIADGVVAPHSLVEVLDAYEREQRTAETLTFAVDKMPAPPAPSDAALQAYYEAHADQFMAPEMRAVSTVTVRIDDLKGDIKPSDSDIAKVFEARAAEFQTPEKRTIRQIVFDSEEKAATFLAKLGPQGDFSALAKSESLTVVDLGQMERADIPFPELADAAFNAPKPGRVGPIHTVLGWHVLDIAAITPGSARPLSAVRDTIVAGLVKDEATNRLFTLSTKLEDAIGSGATIDEAATAVGVKPRVIAAIDRQGNDASGKSVGEPAEFLASVFSTAAGAVSDVQSYRDGSGYFVVRVDSVTPAARKPFEAVKADVRTLWTAERRAETARQQADAALQRLKAGEGLSAVAGASGVSLTVQTTKPFLRTQDKSAGAAAPAVSPALASAVFALSKPGEATLVMLPEGPTIARLKEIVPVDMQTESLQTPTARLSQTLSTDLLQEYIDALKGDLSVQVNTALIDKQFAKP